MVKEKIYAELLAANLKWILAPDKCEAHAQFQEKVSEPIDQCALKIALLGR